jgi:hypothetical protein
MRGEDRRRRDRGRMEVGVLHLQGCAVKALEQVELRPGTRRFAPHEVARRLALVLMKRARAVVGNEPLLEPHPRDQHMPQRLQVGTCMGQVSTRRPGRIAIAAAGDDRAAVMQLIDRLGFDAVDAGPLEAGRALEPDGSVFGAAYSADELTNLLSPAASSA